MSGFRTVWVLKNYQTSGPEVMSGRALKDNIIYELFCMYSVQTYVSLVVKVFAKGRNNLYDSGMDLSSMYIERSSPFRKFLKPNISI